jgi:hypothetical protein
MRSFRRHISLLLALLACSAVRGVSLDSLMNLPVIGAPLINYSPETNWVFGAGIQGYVLLPEAEKTSVLQLDGAWSMKHQWYINAHANLYYDEGDNNISVTTNKIGVKPFTIDGIAIVHLPFFLDVYCKYSPMKLFKEGRGPEAHQLTFGLCF